MLRKHLCASLVIVWACGANGNPNVERSILAKTSRQMLAAAHANGVTTITILAVGEPSQTGQVVRRAGELGGVLRHVDAELGYLRIELPADRVNEFVRTVDVQATVVDYYPSEPETHPLGLEVKRARSDPAVAADYARLSNAYRPTADIGALRLRDRNPAFDGRGVTVALLDGDGNVDALLPEFQTAYSLDGSRIPKLAQIVTTSDPRTDAADVPQWVIMDRVVEAVDGRFRVGAQQFGAPRSGRFRFGYLSERRFADGSLSQTALAQDFDNSHNPPGDDGRFAVLWDEAADTVWVDVNRNSDFRDEPALHDYDTTAQIGVFGSDDPHTPERESVAFGVQIDREHHAIALNLGLGSHSTSVMGAVVGNSDPHGHLDGIAPGARLASFDTGSYANLHAAVEGLIRAFRTPGVDVIVSEAGLGSCTRGEGRDVFALIADRLIQRYDKPLFIIAGNSNGLGLVDGCGAGPRTISVGAYQSQASYLNTLGFAPAGYDHSHRGGGRHGPAADGGLKPDLLAPSGQISLRPGYIVEPPKASGLPPGYAIDGGTSTAGPMAAGAAALVISAARQSHVPYDAIRLKAALLSSARHICELPEFVQGNGLVQVDAAFDLLKEFAQSPPISVESAAPVRTRDSGVLASPDRGAGLYEREGWSVGQRGTRPVRFTRLSGPSGSMRFRVSWRGNDGTFTSPRSIALPLNRPVEFPIDIQVTSPGAHAGTLTFDLPDRPSQSYRMPATIIAPFDFTSKNNYQVEAHVVVQPVDDQAIFLRVPAGADALVFTLTGPQPDFSVTAISPSGAPSRPCLTNEAAGGLNCAVSRPETGVWEINVTHFPQEARLSVATGGPLGPVNATIKASVFGARLETHGIVHAGSGQVEVDVANRFAALTHPSLLGEVGAAFSTTRRIGAGEQQSYEIIVPKGATALAARVAPSSRADLDLYLIDCTSGHCSARMREAATSGAGGEIEVRDPAPGRWFAVVDAAGAPASGTSYHYQDLYVHPDFGTASPVRLSPTDRHGQGWRARAQLAGKTNAPPGRALVARYFATTTSEPLAGKTPTVVGSAQLELQGSGVSR
jgi:hypothetical protein